MNSALEFKSPLISEISATHLLAGDQPVIIVDDDPDAAVRTENVIAKLPPTCPVRVLNSGEDLVGYLQGEDLYSDQGGHPYPALVLLDLEMPGMNGFEVLHWLRDHPEHADLPVVVLSGWYELSQLATRACQLGARSFLPKPVQLHDIRGVLAVLNISI